MLARALAGLERLLGRSSRSATAEEEDRRLWGRVDCDLETTIAPASRGEPEASLPARARNVSRGGINLMVARAFEPGTLLSVALPVGDGIEVLACVMRCDAREGAWDIGCTFAAQLSDEELKQFGAKREKTPPSDQRTWVRYTCQATATYRVVRSGTTNDAVVLNISANGIALEVSELLRVGELLNLELSRDGEIRLTTLASVVRTTCTPDGRRIVGCNFICELTDEQVEMLL